MILFAIMFILFFIGAVFFIVLPHERALKGKQ